MPLPFPDLDDRDFTQLVKQALAEIRTNLNTGWDDLSEGDPGVVLLEVFAHLTDQMIYRLNRLPRKVYIAFLRLLGVTIDPPMAAYATLKVWHPATVESSIKKPSSLPRGSLVTTAQTGAVGAGERPVFTIVQDVEVPTTCTSEASAVSVLAYHCERVEESLGVSTGLAGQFFQVQRPPIVAHLPGEIRWLELTLGVEVFPSERRDDDWTGSDGKAYRLWQEDENFAASSASDEVFLVDRQSGLIHFAPAARRAAGQPIHPLAAIPPAGREIRIWYPHGGGEAGNVLAGQLTVLVSVPHQTGLPAIALTNPEPARGGLDADSLENALVLGPQDLYSQRRAVTGHDFENAVLRFRHIVRARAITQAQQWQHGIPGTVDIVLVPRLAQAQTPNLDTLLSRQDLVDLSQVEAMLRERSPMGICSNLRWARYKQVRVQAQLTYSSNEEPQVIEQRIIQRLNRLLSPLPTVPSAERTGEGTDSAFFAGWPFGQQLRVADIYNLILSGDGSKPLVNSLDLHLVHAPTKNITCLAADLFQPHTWYVGSGSSLFRSTNDGTGWELILHHVSSSPDNIFYRLGGNWAPGPIPRDETIRHVCPSPDRPGMVALSTEIAQEGALHSSLYLSLDCGESWYHLAVSQEVANQFRPGRIEDLTWLMRADRPVLLLATDHGLLEVNPFNAGGELDDPDVFQVTILPGQPAYPVYALAIVRSPRGSNQVVVALQGRKGLYISSGDNLASQNSFTPLTLKVGDRPLGEDIRHLRVQYLNERIYLWAGVMALSDQGLGCYRWQMFQSDRLVEEGRWISQGWNGGSCLGVAFDDNQVYAATAWGGLLRADHDEQHPNRLLTWNSFPNLDLPHRPSQLEAESRPQANLEPLIAIDTREGVVMVATQNGIYRRRRPEPDFENERYEKISRDTFSNLKDIITIPPDWLLLPGTHDIQASFDPGFNHLPGSLEPDDLLGEPPASAPGEWAPPSSADDAEEDA